MGWMTQSNNEGIDGKQVGGTIRHARDPQAVANWPVDTIGEKNLFVYLSVYPSICLSIGSTFEAYK